MTSQIQVFAGRLKYFYNEWRKITNDKFILDVILGYRIPFTSPPLQDLVTKSNKKISNKESLAIAEELKHLTEINAIEKCQPIKGQFVSDIFLMPKKTGGARLILNLKKLNKYLDTDHFKMEDIRTATKLVTKNCFMCHIDLKEAYFLISIHESCRKYLRFYFKSTLYEFTALPFGLSSAPYIFTKILFPVTAHLRSHGFKSVRFLDDQLLIGDRLGDCHANVMTTIQFLERLGFVINYEKSNLEPRQECKFLGFIINSQKMTLKLPESKALNIKQKAELILKIKRIKIREFARFLGSLTAACPAVTYGWLHTKTLERARYLALLGNNEDYDSYMTISNDLHYDLTWWRDNVTSSYNSIRQYKFELEVYTDASSTGWGAACDGEKTGGLWSEDESLYHINYLELLAVYLGLTTFAKTKTNCDILLRVDNTTAISYVNRMGGVQYPHLNKIANMIWSWCEKRNIFIFASYIKSSQNIEADSESRKINIDTEWQLSTNAFRKILLNLGQPQIDLFASRINAKCPIYISWKKDPYAYNIDAFTIDWSLFFFYAFPPFSIILKVLNKIVHDQATGIVVVPLWPSQPWYPLFKYLVISEIVTFPPSKYLLSSHFRTSHPLHYQLTLVASVLSGKPLSDGGSLKRL